MINLTLVIEIQNIILETDNFHDITSMEILYLPTFGTRLWQEDWHQYEDGLVFGGGKAPLG